MQKRKKKIEEIIHSFSEIETMGRILRYAYL